MLRSLLPILLVAGSHYVQANAVGAAGFSQVISYQYQLYSECSTFFETCQPTIAACASALCQNCNTVGILYKAEQSCCAEATPAPCFAALQNGGSSVSPVAPPSTSAAAPNSHAASASASASPSASAAPRTHPATTTATGAVSSSAAASSSGSGSGTKSNSASREVYMLECWITLVVAIGALCLYL